MASGVSARVTRTALSAKLHHTNNAIPYSPPSLFSFPSRTVAEMRVGIGLEPLRRLIKHRMAHGTLAYSIQS